MPKFKNAENVSSNHESNPTMTACNLTSLSVVFTWNVDIKPTKKHFGVTISAIADNFAPMNIESAGFIKKSFDSLLLSTTKFRFGNPVIRIDRGQAAAVIPVYTLEVDKILSNKEIVDKKYAIADLIGQIKSGFIFSRCTYEVHPPLNTEKKPAKEVKVTKGALKTTKPKKEPTGFVTSQGQAV